MSWAASVLIDERVRDYVGSVDARKEGERHLRHEAGRHLAETLPLDQPTVVKLSISEHPVRYPYPHRGDTELRIDVETRPVHSMTVHAVHLNGHGAIRPQAEVAVDHLTDLLTTNTPMEEILGVMQSYLDKAKDEVREGHEGWDTGVRYRGRRLLVEGDKVDGLKMMELLKAAAHQVNDDLGRDLTLGQITRAWISQ